MGARICLQTPRRCSMRWRCIACGAVADIPARPAYCMRCDAHCSYYPQVQSPAPAPPRQRPMRASDLGGLRYAAAIGRGWTDVIGQVGRPLRVLAWGPAGTLKTTRVLDLAEGIADGWGGDVLYLAADEGRDSVSFRDKLARGEIVKTMVMSGGWRDLADELGRNRYVAACIDTINRVGIVPGEATDYTQSLGVSWLMIAEATKDGDLYRGEAGWGHWADIVLRFEPTKMVIEKNRYGQAGKEVEHVR